MTKHDQQFKEQGGMATMDPSFIRRWLISKVMTAQADEKRMLAKRQKAEKKRIKAGHRHVVEYFHQVDDGYSHLAAQSLQALTKRYDIELRINLVSANTGLNTAEPALLAELSLIDAKSVAPYYCVNGALTFPEVKTLPSNQNIIKAQAILAKFLGAASPDDFIAHAAAISTALWRNDKDTLENYANEFGVANEKTVTALIEKGNAKREQLKHYSSAMFYYGEEWYWGIDRLCHLEERLRSLGVDKQSQAPNIFERPKINLTDAKNSVNDHSNLTLEIFASLRSPYTAIAFDRAIQLAKDTGINYRIRPVLPMVMRGVPATKEKGLYILFDTAREARSAGVTYGNVRDPIGQPARHGYALYFWALTHNKGAELFSNFLRGAFAEGINTNTSRGLRWVVEQSGLDWQEAKQHIKDTSWQATLEENRLAMYESGLWGVPSFRLLDEQENEILATWGQDRLWLIADKIVGSINNR
jgi:2-hydroxychromene-2-carboxylate isomerase